MGVIADYKSRASATTGGGAIASFGRRSSADLTTSEGLLELARERGGAVRRVAEEIEDPSEGFLSRFADVSKRKFSQIIRGLNVPVNIIAGALDPNTSVREAVRTGLLPQN